MEEDEVEGFGARSAIFQGTSGFIDSSGFGAVMTANRKALRALKILPEKVERSSVTVDQTITG